MAEVVPSEVQTESGFQVCPFLTESVRKSCQSADLHSHGQIGALDMRRTNPFRVGVSPHGFNRYVHHLWWRIPVFFLGGSGIDFNQLRAVNASPKAGMDGVKVRRKAIGSYLEVPRCGPFQFFRKSHRVACRAASKVPSQHQFCVALDCDKGIGVAAKRVASDVAFLFASDKSPKFVKLQIGHRYIANSALQEEFAFLAYQDEQSADCAVVDAGKTLDGAH